MKKILVIHPNDPTTQDCAALYKDLPNVTKLDEHNSDKEIVNAIRYGNYDLIMMLGHGGEDGMYAPTGKKSYQQFGRTIISPEHVWLLRDKMCFAVWCNANIFAMKYKLTGFFTGMVISELYEAHDCSVPVKDQDEMKAHNIFYCHSLRDCFDKYSLNEIPKKMEHYITGRKMTPVEEFNFNSAFYFDKGESKEMDR